MGTTVKQILALIEEDRIKVLAMVSTISEQKFFQQSDNKWSISQILVHLVATERLSLQYMKKKSLGINDLESSGWLEEVKLLLLKLSQRLPLKYKAPKVLENSPQSKPLSELKEQWSEVRNDLKLFLEGLGDQNAKKKIYKHPIAGRLDAIQGVIFLREHIHHHMPQIRRLLKD